MKRYLLAIILILWAIPSFATWTAGSHATGQSTDATNATAGTGDANGSGAINSTSAKLITAAMSYDPSCTTVGITDSASNTWEYLGVLPETGPSGSTTAIFRNTGIIHTSASHTFRPNITGCSVHPYPSIVVQVWNNGSSNAGSIVDPFATAVNSSNASPVAAGSITPSFSNEVVLAAAGMAVASGVWGSTPAGFTLSAALNQSNGFAYGVALAYQIQTTPTAANPSWAYTPTGSGNPAQAINVAVLNNVPQCTGSSPNWTAASFADIETCHTVASNADTITVTPGSYTALTPGMQVTKAVTIVGTGVTVTDSVCNGLCQLGVSDSDIVLYESSAGNIRLQNFTWDSGTSFHRNPSGMVNTVLQPGGLPVVAQGMTFNDAGGSDLIIWSSNRGVISGNTADGTGALSGGGCTNEIAFVRQYMPDDSTWMTPPTYGTADTGGNQNLYIETNTLTNILQGIDIGKAGRVVIRYNNMTNSASLTHGDSGTSGRYIEFYNNPITRDSTTHSSCGGLTTGVTAFLTLRGGTALVHHNVIPDPNDIDWSSGHAVNFWADTLTSSNGPFACWDHGDSTAGGGYPMPMNVGWGYSTGATNPHTSFGWFDSGTPASGNSNWFQDLEPVYLWANTGTGNYNAPVIFTLSPTDPNNGCQTSGVSPPFQTGTDYIQENREWYNATDAPSGKPGYTPYQYPHPLVATAESSRMHFRRP